MEEIKLVVVKLILRLLVISKNRFIYIKKIVIIRKKYREQIMQSYDIGIFVFLEIILIIIDEVGNVVEEYNLDVKKIFEMLDDANI